MTWAERPHGEPGREGLTYLGRRPCGPASSREKKVSTGARPGPVPPSPATAPRAVIRALRSAILDRAAMSMW